MTAHAAVRTGKQTTRGSHRESESGHTAKGNAPPTELGWAKSPLSPYLYPSPPSQAGSDQGQASLDRMRRRRTSTLCSHHTRRWGFITIQRIFLTQPRLLTNCAGSER